MERTEMGPVLCGSLSRTHILFSTPLLLAWGCIKGITVWWQQQNWCTCDKKLHETLKFLIMYYIFWKLNISMVCYHYILHFWFHRKTFKFQLFLLVHNLKTKRFEQSWIFFKTFRLSIYIFHISESQNLSQDLTSPLGPVGRFAPQCTWSQK